MSQLENLDVTTSPDAQEAESRKYAAWRVLQLESGRFAIWDDIWGFKGIFDGLAEVDLRYVHRERNQIQLLTHAVRELIHLDDIVEQLKGKLRNRRQEDEATR